MEFRDKRTWLKWLVLECPVGRALDSCPVREYRNMPAEKSFILVDEMATDHVEGIIAYHKTCLSERESFLKG